MNKSEIEYYETKEYFQEICENYNVDNRLVYSMMNEVEMHYRTNTDELLNNKTKILSNQLLAQLESYV